MWSKMNMNCEWILSIQSRRYVLEKNNNYLVGRQDHEDDKIDIKLVGNEIDKKHAVIFVSAQNHAKLVDLRTDNGTFINSKAIPALYVFAIKQPAIISFGSIKGEIAIREVASASTNNEKQDSNRSADFLTRTLPLPDTARAPSASQLNETFTLPNPNDQSILGSDVVDFETVSPINCSTPHPVLEYSRLESSNHQYDTIDVMPGVALYKKDTKVSRGTNDKELCLRRSSRQRQTRISSDFKFSGPTKTRRWLRSRRKRKLKVSSTTARVEGAPDYKKQPAISNQGVFQLHVAQGNELTNDYSKPEQCQSKFATVKDVQPVNQKNNSNLQSPNMGTDAINEQTFLVNEPDGPELDLVSLLSLISQRNSTTGSSLRSFGASQRSGSVTIDEQKITLYTNQIYLIGHKDQELTNCLVDVSIDSSKVDEKHAIIEVCDDGKTYIIDLRSRYGTLLNGRPIKPLTRTSAKNNDNVIFGDKSGKLEILPVENISNNSTN